MKKKLLGIVSVVFLSIFIINSPKSFAQIIPCESIEQVNDTDLGSYFFDRPLFWPYQTNFYLNKLPYSVFQDNPFGFLYGYFFNMYHYNTVVSPIGYGCSWPIPWNYSYKYPTPILAGSESLTNSKISATAHGHIIDLPDAEWVSFNGVSGMSPPTMNVPISTMQEVVFDVQIPGMEVRQKAEEGITYQQVSIEGSGCITEIGKPQLPMISKFVPIPSGATIEVEVVDSSFDMMEGYTIYPAQEPLLAIEDAPTPPFMIDEAQYQRDEFYPNELVEIEGPIVIRGCSVAIMRIYPVQFNPIKETLRVYSHLQVKVSFQGGEEYYIEDRLRSSSFDKTFNRIFGNASMTNFEQQMSDQHDDGKFLLIITHPNFKIAAQTLAAWKIKKGIQTVVATTDIIPANIPTKPTAEEIAVYIQQFYDQWDSPLSHLLLIGDAEFVPCHYKTEHIDASQGFIGTDLYYTTLDGTDYFPDISVGRLSVDTLAQANKRVRDIIRYEKACVLDEDYYTHAACASYFQDKDYNQVEDVRFVLTSEDIRNHLIDNGFDVDRIYRAYDSVSPRYYLESAWPWPYEPLTLEERELPLELQRPNFAWNGDADNISGAINSGRFLMVHVGHGSKFRWASPFYRTYHVEALENGDKLPVVWSINCMTGWFDNETDNPVVDTPAHAIHFSEAWERNPNGGAIGVIAGTRTSYCIHCDRLIWGWMDAIWPDFNPDYTPLDTNFDDPQFEMGQVLNYGKFYYASLHQESEVRQLEFEVFQWFGDPTMQIWTDVPQALAVCHSSSIIAGATSFDVDVSEPGALICISKEGQILGKALSTGHTVTIPLICSIHLGDAIDITVTKHNFRPYEGVAACFSPLGFHLELTQDHTQVAKGDILAYWVTGVNDTDQIQNVSFAVNVTLPDGQIYPGLGCYLEDPFEITFNPREVKSARLQFPISDLAPLGICTWHGYLLNEVGQVIARDEFTFNIIPYIPPLTPLTVYAIPDKTFIYPFGDRTVTYQVTITNETDLYQDVTFATNVTLPDGSIYPVPPAYHLGPIDLITFGPSESRSAFIELPIPADISTGVYTYTCYILGKEVIIHQNGFNIKILAYGISDPNAALPDSNYLNNLDWVAFDSDQLISGDLGFSFPKLMRK